MKEKRHSKFNGKQIQLQFYFGVVWCENASIVYSWELQAYTHNGYCSKLLTKWKDIVNNSNGYDNGHQVKYDKDKQKEMEYPFTFEHLMKMECFVIKEYMLCMKHAFQFSIRVFFLFILFLHFKHVIRKSVAETSSKSWFCYKLLLFFPILDPSTHKMAKFQLSPAAIAICFHNNKCEDKPTNGYKANA